MKFSKRLKTMNLRWIGVVLALTAFVVVVIGSVTVQGIQETLISDCSAQSTDCIAHELGDIHVIGSLETVIGYQLTQILLEDYEDEIKTLGILLLAVFVGMRFFIQQRANNMPFQYWHATRHWRIKFWDSIHQALTRGIIHSKILDCV